MAQTPKATLRKLTWRNLKAGRFRNIIAVCAIALTALLFTVIATMGGAVLQTFEENTMRQVGTSSHGGLKYLNEAQYENFAQSPLIDEISYNIILGFAQNPELSRQQHEVRYSEDRMAQWDFSYPNIGTMPRGEKDIVMADDSLAALGVPAKLGETIHLVFSVDGVTHEDDFTLVGIYPGDGGAFGRQIYLAKDYVRGLAQAKDHYDEQYYTGAVMASVMLPHTWDIEGQMEELLAERGYTPDEIGIGVNWAYTTSTTPDLTTILLAALALAIIMASGYLIIYSVFAISITGDIHFYGLLKTIGVTGKQLRAIVRRQALLLSIVGIPLGLVLGFGLGTKLAPYAMNMMTMDLRSPIAANPAIFLFAAVFSLITVFISCRKPGRIAGAVSPIEALRYNDSGPKTKKQRHRTHRATPLRLAWDNMSRSKGRLVIVIASLSLSLILLNTVASIVAGFDMNAYLRNQIVADFTLADYSYYNFALSEGNNQGVPREIGPEASALAQYQDGSDVYFSAAPHSLTPAAAERRAALDQENESLTPEQEGMIAPSQATLHVYGGSSFLVDKLEQNFQQIDYAKLASGNYVLVGRYSKSETSMKLIYKVGDKITIVGSDGVPREFEVLGIMDYPYAVSARYSSLDSFDVLMSEANFQAVFGEQNPMLTIFDVAEGTAEETQAWLDGRLSTAFPDVEIRSRDYYVDEFKGVKNTFTIIGGTLAFILGVIGLLNFINTVATSIMARRRELAMLSAVGMTKAQMRLMLFGEGLAYALLTLFITGTIGIGLTALLVKGIAGTIFFFSFQLELTPLLIVAPLLILLCALVPLICSALAERESVVERLRSE